MQEQHSIENAIWLDDEHTMISVMIDGVAMNVPNDPDNRHRAMIAIWEADGGVIGT